MKNLFILFFLLPLFTTAQYKIDKNKIITGSLIAVSGAATGFNETLMHHYYKFKAKFPNANDKWFNPEESWVNKYKDGNCEEGDKFPLSSSLLSFTTDQYHLNAMIRDVSLKAAVTFKLGNGGKKQKFIYYVYDLLYYSACYSLGFYLTYGSFH